MNHERAGDADDAAGEQPAVRHVTASDRAARPPVDVVDDLADDRPAAIRRARRLGGLPGAVLAGALMGLKDVLDPPKDKQAVVVEASSEPHDIDKDGIDMELDGDRRAVSPPLPPIAAHAPRRRRRTRNRER